MFKNAAEFLSIVEHTQPIGSHETFREEWSAGVLQLAEASNLLEDEKQAKALEAVLAFREAVHGAAIASHKGHKDSIQDDSWKWLLTTQQVEQRTPEWYAETRNLLTASEVGRLFEGPGARNSLVRAKTDGQKPIPPPVAPRLAVMANETGPMDWGTRYEPVVKRHLEESLSCKIQDLGRIKHSALPWIAASPDGLITECTSAPELVGRLVEIKCPTTRTISDTIPFDYWCQMQWQMEVCDRPACEFVEVKFRQLKEGDEHTPNAIDRGWITLQNHMETDNNRYVYERVEGHQDPWVTLEMYEWELLHLRRVTVPRDRDWFARSQSIFQAFWKDVADAREGKWTPLPVKARKAKGVESPAATCAIVDDDLDEGSPLSTLAAKVAVVTVPRDVPEPISYTD